MVETVDGAGRYTVAGWLAWQSAQKTEEIGLQCQQVFPWRLSLFDQHFAGHDFALRVRDQRSEQGRLGLNHGCPPLQKRKIWGSVFCL